MSADMLLISGFPTNFSVHLLSRALFPHISPDHPYLLAQVFREESELVSSWLCDCHNSPFYFLTYRYLQNVFVERPKTLDNDLFLLMSLSDKNALSAIQLLFKIHTLH